MVSGKYLFNFFGLLFISSIQIQPTMAEESALSSQNLSLPFTLKIVQAGSISQLRNNTSSFSGVLLKQKDGICHIVTNAHTIDSDEPNAYTIEPIIAADTGSLNLKLLRKGNRKIADKDLALLSFECNKKLNFTPAKLRNPQEIAENTNLYLNGFPRLEKSITSFPVKAITSNILSDNINSSKLITYEIDNKISNDRGSTLYVGMSGGSLIDRNGSLLAIHRQQDSLRPQILYGIPVTFILEGYNDLLQLSTNFIRPKFTDSNSTKQNNVNKKIIQNEVTKPMPHKRLSGGQRG